MAKSKISKILTSNLKLNVEGTLMLDNLEGFVMDVEEYGEQNISEIMKTMNGAYVKLTIVQKDEKEVDPKEVIEIQ